MRNIVSPERNILSGLRVLGLESRTTEMMLLRIQ